MLTIILLGIVSFLTDISSEIIYPIFPLFIKELGGGSVAIGVIGGVREATESLLKILGGIWADKVGRRKGVVFWGYFISSAFKILLSFAINITQVFIFSLFERVGKGIRTAPRDAMIADSAVAHGKGFGVHRTMDTLGAILGSIICLLLLYFLELTFKTIILIASIIGFIALLPIYFVKESPIHKKITRVSKKISKGLKNFILISAIFNLAKFSDMFLIYYVTEFYKEFYFPVLFYVLFNIFYAIGATPLGVLSDKIGRTNVIAIGYLLFAIVCIAFGFLHRPILFFILFPIYGLFYACVNGNQRAYVSDLARENKSTALGIFHTMNSITGMCSNIIVGLLWKIAPKTAFLYSAFISTISILLLKIIIIREKYKSTN